MPYKKGGGRNCAVYNCSNNQRKLGQWRDEYCMIHVGFTHRQCPCREPFRFCNIPQVTKSGDETRRIQWLKAIYRLNLPRTRGVVCSNHFVDGCPTIMNPLPTLNIEPPPKFQTKMTRHHKLERKIGNTDADKMKAAVQLVVGGRSIRSVANELEIKFSTLRRYVEKARNIDCIDDMNFAPNYACRQVFSAAEELSLKEYILQASTIQYGLVSMEVRKLAYEFAHKNKRKYPATWDTNQCAGEDWFLSFMKRHEDISLKTPEATPQDKESKRKSANILKLASKPQKSIIERSLFNKAQEEYQDQSQQQQQQQQIAKLTETVKSALQRSPNKVLEQLQFASHSNFTQTVIVNFEN